MNQKKKLLLSFVGILSLFVLFQNCGQADNTRVAADAFSSEGNDSQGTSGGGEEGLGAEGDQILEVDLPVGGPTVTAASCNLSELDMRWPLDGNNGDLWYIARYGDVVDGAEFADYTGGVRTINDYKRIDIATPYMSFNGATVPVFSADAGTVVALDLSNEDSIVENSLMCSGDSSPNFIAIEHENGYRSVYYNIRQGSVDLSVGDVVAKGASLGAVSATGCSFSPFVAFEVRDCDGEPISIMENRAEIFSGDLPNYEIPQKIIHSAFTTESNLTFRQFLLRSSEATTTAESDNFGMYIFMLEAKQDDFFRCSIRNADGDVLRTTSFTMSQNYTRSFWRCHFEMAGLGGDYFFEWKINGDTLLRRPFTVNP